MIRFRPLLVLLPLLATTAEAQLQDGDVLVNVFGCPSSSSLLGYRLDGTLVFQSSVGTGGCWEGVAHLPSGRIATSRRSPAHGVNVFDPAGTEVASFATPQVGPFPADIDAFADGTIAVCNQGSGVELYDATGSHVQSITVPGLVRSFGVHVDANDHLWIADIATVGANNGGVFHLDRQGNLLGSFSTSFEASDVVVANDGSLWVTDRNNGVVFHLMADGTVLSSFSAVAPGLRMSGLALLPDGTLVCTAEQDPRLLRYDANGNLLGVVNLPAGAQPLFLDVVAGQVWSNLGNALPGAGGAPKLTGQGDLMPNTQVTLTLASAAPNASSTLILGLLEANVAFLGGTLVPSPDILLMGLPTGATGGWVLAGVWPAGVPSGANVHFQAWTADALAPQGYSASNGLRATAP